MPSSGTYHIINAYSGQAIYFKRDARAGSILRLTNSKQSRHSDTKFHLVSYGGGRYTLSNHSWKLHISKNRSHSPDAARGVSLVIYSSGSYYKICDTTKSSYLYITQSKSSVSNSGYKTALGAYRSDSRALWKFVGASSSSGRTGGATKRSSAGTRNRTHKPAAKKSSSSKPAKKSSGGRKTVTKKTPVKKTVIKKPPVQPTRKHPVQLAPRQPPPRPAFQSQNFSLRPTDDYEEDETSNQGGEVGQGGQDTDEEENGGGGNSYGSQAPAPSRSFSSTSPGQSSYGDYGPQVPTPESRPGPFSFLNFTPPPGKAYHPKKGGWYDLTSEPQYDPNVPPFGGPQQPMYPYQGFPGAGLQPPMQPMYPYQGFPGAGPQPPMQPGYSSSNPNGQPFPGAPQPSQPYPGAPGAASDAQASFEAPANGGDEGGTETKARKKDLRSRKGKGRKKRDPYPSGPAPEPVPQVPGEASVAPPDSQAA